MTRRSDLIEYYGMTDDEIYGDKPRVKLCAYCEAIFSDEDIDADHRGWWRVEEYDKCHECRREHLTRLLAKWRNREKSSA